MKSRWSAQGLLGSWPGPHSSQCPTSPGPQACQEVGRASLSMVAGQVALLGSEPGLPTPVLGVGGGDSADGHTVATEASWVGEAWEGTLDGPAGQR